jgi:hypothetical protein
MDYTMKEMKFVIVMLLGAAMTYSVSARDLRELSTKWYCDFEVKKNGIEPVGNFVECNNRKGVVKCGSDTYMFHDEPADYTDINDFVVNFTEKLISFTYSYRPTDKRLSDFPYLAKTVHKEKRSFHIELENSYIVDGSNVTVLSGNENEEKFSNILHSFLFSKSGSRVDWSQLVYSAGGIIGTNTSTGSCYAL